MESLTKEQRMQRVLGSQGFPMGRTFPEATTDALTELCGEDGVLVEDVREKFQHVIGEYHAVMKAEVEAAANEAEQLEKAAKRIVEETPGDNLMERMAATMRQHLLGDVKVEEE